MGANGNREHGDRDGSRRAPGAFEDMPALRIRMVPAGTHFASSEASPASEQAPAERPAGKRFAAAPSGGPSASASRPAVSAPSSGSAGAADAATVPAASGVSVYAASVARRVPGVSVGDSAGVAPRPAGSRFARPAEAASTGDRPGSSARAATSSAHDASAAEPARPAGRRFAPSAQQVNTAQVPGRRFRQAPAAPEVSAPAPTAVPAVSATPPVASVAARVPAVPNPAPPVPTATPSVPTDASVTARIPVQRPEADGDTAVEAALDSLKPQQAVGATGRAASPASAAPSSAVSDTFASAQPVAPLDPARRGGGRRAGRGGAAARIPRGAASDAPMTNAAGNSPTSATDGKPARKRRRGSVLSIVLIVIGVVLLLVAGGLFIATQLRYQQAQSTYSGLQERAITSTAGDDVPTVDFDALAAINPDIVGWIYVPGTPINYPVVQTDDNSTYLHRLFDGTDNASGTVFMDMDDTSPGMIDQQTTIYGHHTYDGTMFQVIDNSTKQEEFDKIEKVYYITRGTTYVLTPLFTAEVEDTYLDVRKPTFSDGDDSLTAYLEDLYTHVRAQAPDAEQLIDSTAKVVSLVTCAGEIVPRTTRAVMVLTLDEAIAHQ